MCHESARHLEAVAGVAVRGGRGRDEGSGFCLVDPVYVSGDPTMPRPYFYKLVLLSTIKEKRLVRKALSLFFLEFDSLLLFYQPDLIMLGADIWVSFGVGSSVAFLGSCWCWVLWLLSELLEMCWTDEGNLCYEGPNPQYFNLMTPEVDQIRVELSMKKNE